MPYISLPVQEGRGTWLPESKDISNVLKNGKKLVAHPRLFGNLLERVCLVTEQAARVLYLGNFMSWDTSQNM